MTTRGCLGHCAGVLATALAAIERTQVDEEHDGGDGDALLSLVSSTSETLGHKFNGAIVRRRRGRPEAGGAATGRV